MVDVNITDFDCRLSKCPYFERIEPPIIEGGIVITGRCTEPDSECWAKGPRMGTEGSEKLKLMMVVGKRDGP